MASADLTLTIRVRDMDRTRLFVYQLRQLRDEMRVSGGVVGPVAHYRERLESLLDRYVEGGDDEGDGVLADEATVEHVETIDEPCPRCGYLGEVP